MATQSEPSGPDLAEGVPAASLPDGGMIGGHVGRGAGPSRPGGRRNPRHRRPLHALRRTARRGLVVGRHGPLPLAPRLLQPADRRGDRGAGLRSRRPAGVVDVHGDRILVSEKLPKPPPPQRPRSSADAASSSSAAAPPASRRPNAAPRGLRGRADDPVAPSRPPDRPAEPLQGLPRRKGAGGLGLPQAGRASTSAAASGSSSAHRRDRARRQATAGHARRRPQPRLRQAAARDRRRAGPPADPRRRPPHVFTLRVARRQPRDHRARPRSAEARSSSARASSGSRSRPRCVARGLEVHVVAPDARPLESVLGRELGRLRARRARSARRASSTSAASRPRSTTRSVVLDDGTALDADLVVMGVGVRPRTDLAERPGCSVDRGVVVDAVSGDQRARHLRRRRHRALPLRAAGGGTVRIEHWVVAERQGQIAALQHARPRRAVSATRPSSGASTTTCASTTSATPRSWDAPKSLATYKTATGWYAFGRTGAHSRSRRSPVTVKTSKPNWSLKPRTRRLPRKRLRPRPGSAAVFDRASGGARRERIAETRVLKV